jgi:hypothetical protein
MEDEGKKRYLIELDPPLAVSVVQFAAVVFYLVYAVSFLKWEISPYFGTVGNFGIVLCLAVVFFFSLRHVKVDEEVIRTHVPFHKDRCGSMRWEDVREVGVYRPCRKKVGCSSPPTRRSGARRI